MFPCSKPELYLIDDRHLVTVPFHQIIRSTTPVFVVAISIPFLGASYRLPTYISLILVCQSPIFIDDQVILGVIAATAGDCYFTIIGLVLTVFGTILAAVKGILTNRLQKSMSSPIHPLDLLLRMSPLACVQSLAYAFLLGETAALRTVISRLPLWNRTILTFSLAVNGALAFGLNYTSFAANKKTSPLTMTVAANVKQCLSIVLGIWIFRLTVGWMNALGIIITLAGGAWYAKMELMGTNKHEANELILKVDKGVA